MLEVRQGDCLELLKNVADGCVDLILADQPYGKTACEWDAVIDQDKLWPELTRVIKPNGVIALFGSEPFSTKMKMHALDIFKYDLYWLKNTSANFTHAKNMPLNNVETVSIFSKAPIGHKSLLGDKRMTYNPQGIVPCNKVCNGKSKHRAIMTSRPSHKESYVQEFTNYPDVRLVFDVIPQQDKAHPSEKPIALLEHLIKTYTNKNGMVLDFCMGSGSTAIAALKCDRSFMGFELDEHYYGVCCDRINKFFIDNTCFL